MSMRMCQLLAALFMFMFTGRCEGLAARNNKPANSPPLPTKQIASRRGMLSLSILVATSAPSASLALDMDAFMNQELSKGEKSMTNDEALCKFGQPSPARGEACVRAGLSSTLSSKGGVDAFGNVDRGDYVKCKEVYEIENGKYVKKLQCRR